MDRAEKLHGLLWFVRNHVPFYKSLGLLKEENYLDIWDSIPIVTKVQIRDNYLEFISDEYDQSNLCRIIKEGTDSYKEHEYQVGNQIIVTEYTTGSTGIPFLSMKTIQERMVLGKNLWRIRNQFSPVKIEDMFCFIHNYERMDYPFPFERINDTKKRIKKEFGFLESSNYKWWHVNVNRLEYYYRWLLQEKPEFKYLQVIENNGAYISEADKEKYGKAFKCKIADNYGCRETWTIAYDCPMGYMHVSPTVFFELVDDDNCVIHEHNKVGNIIVTSLNQRIMPFVRYAVGDRAYYIAGECGCGNRMKRIKLLPGRYCIKGTNKYGNAVFRRVLLNLVHRYKIEHYDEIAVIQCAMKKFRVNTKGLEYSRVEFEQAFMILANEELESNSYEYEFTYCSTLQSKSIFSVSFD